MKKLMKGAFLLSSMMLVGGCSAIGDGTQIDETLSISDGGYISISAGPSKVSVQKSPDDKVHLTYYEYQNVKYKLTENDDGFSIEQNVENNTPTEGIKDITILVPADLVIGAFDSTTGSGGITVRDISADSIDVTGGSGDITVRDVSADSIDVTGGSGGITVTDISVNSIDVASGSGGATVTDISADSIDVASGSEGATVTDISADSINVASGSGDSKFIRLDAVEIIYIGVGSGDVEASIVGSRGDFNVILSGSGKGSNNLSAGGNGAKKLYVETSTSGDINITFTTR